MHRAIFGTFDRFTAFLIEETKGNFPLWLAPVQLNVIPVNNEYHLEYASKVVNDLKELGYRVELDDRNEKLSYKMREAQVSKIPVSLILGQREVDNKEISYRLYGSNETTTLSFDEFKKYLSDRMENKQ